MPDGRDREADLDHRLLEPLAVLGGRDRLRVRADELDAVSPRLPTTPRSASAIARFSAVCPPSVGSTASGRSRSMIFVRTSGVSGST